MAVVEGMVCSGDRIDHRWMMVHVEESCFFNTSD